jgi:hypothetical protein
LLEVVALELFDSVARLVTADGKASEVGDFLKTGSSGIEKGSGVLGLLFVDIILVVFIVIFLLDARIFVFIPLGGNASLVNSCVFLLGSTIAVGRSFSLSSLCSSLCSYWTSSAMEDAVIGLRLGARAVVIHGRHAETRAFGDLCSYESVNILSCSLGHYLVESFNVLFCRKNSGIVVLLVFIIARREWPD